MSESNGGWHVEAWPGERGAKLFAVVSDNDALVITSGLGERVDHASAALMAASKGLRDAVRAVRAWCAQYEVLQAYRESAQTIVIEIDAACSQGGWVAEDGHWYGKVPAYAVVSDAGVLAITTGLGYEVDKANATLMAAAKGYRDALVVARGWCAQFERKSGHEAVAICVLMLIGKALALTGARK